jgi:hypothetical protein
MGGLASLEAPMRITIALSFAVACLLPTPAFAHHSFFAEFDANSPVKLTGTVTRIEWQNPHAWFYIDVKDVSGAVTNWGMELGSPNLLIRAGWTRNALKVGDVVTVEASRARDGSSIANAKLVILANTGRKLFAASSQTQSPRQ